MIRANWPAKRRMRLGYPTPYPTSKEQTEEPYLSLLADSTLFHLVEQGLVAHTEVVGCFSSIPAKAIERLLNRCSLGSHRGLSREFGLTPAARTGVAGEARPPLQTSFDYFGAARGVS